MNHNSPYISPANRFFNHDGWTEPRPTAVLILEDGTRIEGQGLGATGSAVGEICFNTSITGYQEILTDPSYAGQIIAFTFPHIGNVGANEEDLEIINAGLDSPARGVIVKTDVTDPSNYRQMQHFDDWLKSRGIIGISGLDTRALTSLIREKGFVNASICHDEEGDFNEPELLKDVQDWPGLEGMDLAKSVSSEQNSQWDQTPWVWSEGFGEVSNAKHHIVAIDYGAKRNILRLLAMQGCRVTVVPATASSQAIMSLNPDGIFLSNGPGDPAATGEYAIKTVQDLLKQDLPMFGICLGHQILALALGGKTKKMHQGHHGANHPVMDHTTGKVEITSMNHGFTVDGDSLGTDIEQTHISLFDQSNCGLRLRDKPVFSVQHHPEASPGPQDSYYLFKRFLDLIEEHKKSN